MSKELMNLIIIREDGSRTSWRMRRLWWRLAILSLVILPCVVGGMGWLCWQLWMRDQAAGAEIESLRSQKEALERKMDRLAPLSALLNEENVPGRGVVIRSMASRMETAATNGGATPPAPQKAATVKSDADAVRTLSAKGEEAPKNGDAVKDASGDVPADTPDEGGLGRQMAQSDGPGHTEFPSMNKDYVAVQNVRARLSGGAMRLMLDLRNTKSAVAEGTVVPWLVTTEGGKRPLAVVPPEAAWFRIMRFKHAVLNVTLPKEGSAPGDQVIIEVRRNRDKEIVFRDLYAIER